MKHSPAISISWSSERSLRVVLGDDTSLETHLRVRAALGRLQGASLPGLIDLTPAYSTVLATFDPHHLDCDATERQVADLLSAPESPAEVHLRPIIEIPICYASDHAPDLASLANLHHITTDEVIRLHTQPTYYVSFLGFSPGFAYLGGLDDRLATPRLDRPRTRVPAGSVGIAGSQTGIYPSATPGGWQLIGQTPLQMFDPARPSPSILAIGDRVRFIPITADQFQAQSQAVK